MTPAHPGATGTAPTTPATPAEVPGARHSTVTVGEAVVLGTTGLVLLTAVAGFGTALFGRFSLWAVAFWVVLGAAAVTLALQRRIRARGLRFDRAEALMLGGVGAVAAFFYFPGFHYAVGDRDPGIYMATGAHIARTGMLQAISPEYATLIGPSVVQKPLLMVQPGFWVNDFGTGDLEQQFYHLWSGLLAVAYRLRGLAAEAAVTPAVAVVSVLLGALLARRVGGLAVGWLTGLLLTVNMMQVWQAKYPSTEIFAQCLFLGALLAAVIAVQSGSRVAAGAAGALIGAGYLARPDGVLMIWAAAGILAAWWVVAGWDIRIKWFIGSLLVAGAVAEVNAYGVSDYYTALNLPRPTLQFAGLVVLTVVAVAARGLVRRRSALVHPGPRLRRRLATGVSVGYAVLFVLAVVRPAFGPHSINYNGRIIRDYREESLIWLSWFFTWPGLVLMLVGIMVLLHQRWSATQALALMPLAVLLPIYLWDPHNSPYLMWWGRRFVPASVPMMTIAIAIALVFLWHIGGRVVRQRWARLSLVAGRGVSVGLAGTLLVVFTLQSLPLRRFDEWGGSYRVVQSIVEPAGTDRAVYLWPSTGPCCGQPELLFAIPVWFFFGHASLYLPPNPVTWPDVVASALSHYGIDRTVFVVMPGADLPSTLDTSDPRFELTAERRLSGSLDHWEDSAVSRPKEAVQIPYDVTVYRATPG